MSLNVELLRKVKAHVLAEPRRVNMKIGACEVSVKNAPLGIPQGDDAPPCGTVGCIAGWACILGSKLTKEQLEGLVEYPWGSLESMAKEALGITGSAASIFYIEDWPTDLYNRYREGNQQQKAEAVAERIDRMIADTTLS